MVPGGPRTRRTREPMTNKAESLTKYELRIAVLSARGCTNHEMAEQCFVSVNTVKTHVARILRKLEAHNKVQAIAILMMDEDFRALVDSEVDLTDVSAIRPGRIPAVAGVA